MAMHLNPPLNSPPQPMLQMHPDNNYQPYPIQKLFTYRPHNQLDDHHYNPILTNHMEQPKPQLSQYDHFDRIDNSFLQLDFSSFLLPPGMNHNSNEWFSYDFYSAMRETGNEMEGLQTGLLDPNLVNQEHHFQGNMIDPPHAAMIGRTLLEQPLSREDPTPSNESKTASNEITPDLSPLNVPSDDDKWPFMWNPSPNQILTAERIDIPTGHRLFRAHKTRFDITENTFHGVQAFLTPPPGREALDSQTGTFTLPSLPVINVFIGLFFKHFSSQMPVLHHPTVDTNTDLPPPLLAAIIIIGATYSGLKNSRRFAIVLVDVVRWHLQIALEFDNSLMRESMIIYAEALICYVGLWCGNKRAFELAEVVRGALVTYIRRIAFGLNPELEHADDGVVQQDPIQYEWTKWTAKESQMRLFWVVYCIDLQFPTILNLSATIAMGEVSHLCCPCDDIFWTSPSAHNWKSMLGPALVPPSRSFSAAVGPFVLNTSRAGIDQYQSMHQGLPKLDLNEWSAFLVLITIQNEVFQFSHQSNIALAFTRYGQSQTNGMNEDDEVITILQKLQNNRRTQLLESLTSWSSTYLPLAHNPIHPLTHFQRCSATIHHLSTILLDVSLTDLQGALGKEGPQGIAPALARLKSWSNLDPQKAETCAYNAVRAIISLAPSKGQGGGTETTPETIITLFLCHLVIWVFAIVCERCSYSRFLEMVKAGPGGVGNSLFYNEVLRGIEALGEELSGKEECERERERVNGRMRVLVFKNAAEVLTRLGVWGAALNLAMLLQRRAET